MQLHPFPEPAAPELERYTLYGRGEIIAVIRRLCEARSLVTAYFGGEGRFAVTMALQVNPEFDEVVFDEPADPQAREGLAKAGGVTFVAFQDSVKLQFEVPVVQATSFEGRPALRVRLPGALLRLQRREFFRVRAPVHAPASCLVPTQGAPGRYESLEVRNLSVGGVAVMSYPHDCELPVAQPIDACFLDLPGIGTVPVTVRVVHVTRATGAEHEFGCEFVDISQQARLMIQRYVNRVESEARRERELQRLTAE